jgi:hypothetical protein
MKKLGLLFFMVMVTVSGAVSQTSNFIEVTVDDTIKLKAIKISYLISENPYSFNESYETNDTKREENKRAPESPLALAEKKLKANKYTYSAYNESKNYRINNTESYDYDLLKNKNGWLVELNGVKELEAFYNLFQNEKGIEGKIVDVVFESKDQYAEILLKRLYTKAQKEAEVLAGLAGLKIGKIMSVSEASSNTSYSMMDWYKDILSFGKFEDSFFGKDLSTVYNRKLTFKFSVN